MVDTFMLGLKLAAIAGFVLAILLIKLIRPRWETSDNECRDCVRCTEPILVSLWKEPLTGPWRTVQRLWLRQCPKCRHRLILDHGYTDEGRFRD